MSQLTTAARPARTARQLANIKEINKVKSAIRWHERAREKRKKIVAQRYEDKRAYLARGRHYRDSVLKPIRQAKKNLKEDYELGPLRPNRAVGQNAATYGVLGVNGLRSARMPVDTHRRKNEVREARGLEPEYPLVVDDKKYFPIAVNDRVMVMKGREAGKIGVVSEVDEDSHDVVIKDINKQYADAKVFNRPAGEEAVNKRETEVAIPFQNVRLVIPYRITAKNKDGMPVSTYTDVIVDKLVMERHTTGKDPFTGVDYGNLEFPEEHRFDPVTGLPIFNRYIAGTRRRIQWPWETDVEGEQDDHLAAQENPNRYTSVMHKIKHPIATLKEMKNSFSKPKPTVAQPDVPKLTEAEKQQIRLEEKIAQIEKVPDALRSAPHNLPDDFEDDTGRNKAEPSPETNSFLPTLVYPPFPNQLVPELREHEKQVRLEEQNEKQNWYEQPSKVTKELREERKLAKLEKSKKRAIPDSMKTPLQLRWEVERKKKLEAEKASPKVDREALMIALGQHMLAKKQAAAQPKKDKAVELD